MNEDWRDKIAAQQRHEHLAATVRIAIGELCYAAEQSNHLPTAERIYGIVDVLDSQLREHEVEYESPVLAPLLPPAKKK